MESNLITIALKFTSTISLTRAAFARRLRRLRRGLNRIGSRGIPPGEHYRFPPEGERANRITTWGLSPRRSTISKIEIAHSGPSPLRRTHNLHSISNVLPRPQSLIVVAIVCKYDHLRRRAETREVVCVPECVSLGRPTSPEVFVSCVCALLPHR